MKSIVGRRKNVYNKYSIDQERKEIMLSFPKEMIRRYKEPILYVVFGGLTTLVNIISYFLLTRFAQTDTCLLYTSRCVYETVR